MSDQVDQLRRELVDAHRSEGRDPTRKARGLAELMDAADRAPVAAPSRKPMRLIVGGLVLLGAVGLIALSTSRTKKAPPPPSDVAPPPVVVAEPPKPPTEPATPKIEAPPAPVEVVAEPVKPSEPAPPTVRRPVPIVRDDADTLAKELALVDRARSQRTDAPAAALQTLAEYDAQFPKGALTQEASLVRIEALLALGRRAEAETLARTLIAKDRGGLLKKRVEALLAR